MTAPRTVTRRTAGVAGALHWAAARMPFVEDEVAGLREFVRPGDVCLDVGAEYGLYTWALSHLVGGAGQVHSVEPLPGPARWLRLASRTLGCANVVVHRTALGSRTGHGVLSLPMRRGTPVHGRAYLTEGTDGPGPNAEFRTSRPVPTTVDTLDRLVRGAGLEKVSFVKADVEGPNRPCSKAPATPCCATGRCSCWRSSTGTSRSTGRARRTWSAGSGRSATGCAAGTAAAGRRPGRSGTTAATTCSPTDLHRLTFSD